MFRSNKQALIEVAKAMQDMAESQVTRIEEEIEERRREDRVEETERNRKHELEIAKMFATAFASIHQTAYHNQFLSFHALQGTMVPMQSPTEFNSPRLTPPYSSTPRSNPRYRFVNELNNELG